MNQLNDYQFEAMRRMPVQAHNEAIPVEENHLWTKYQYRGEDGRLYLVHQKIVRSVVHYPEGKQTYEELDGDMSLPPKHDNIGYTQLPAGE